MRDLEYGIVAKDRTGPAYDSAEARAKRFNAEIGKATAAYGMAATAAKAFAGAFMLSSVAQFGQIVRDVIGDAADLVDLADKVGVATDDVQRLQYGFKLAGIEAGEVDGLLTQWSKRIGEAYTSGGKLADILKANGISLTDGEGKLRSSVDLMRDYADLVSRAGSDQERMTLALAGFGKAGDDIALAFRDGAKGFDELMAKADEAGGLLDEEILRKAAAIDDEFDRMWRTFEIGAKSAILNTVALLNDNSGAVANFFSAGAALTGIQAWIDRGKQAADIVNGQIETIKKGIDLIENGPTADRQVGRLPYVSDPDLAARFDMTPSAENSDLTRLLRDKFAPKTVIPDDTATRRSSATAATEQASAYEKVVEKLKEEQSVIGLSAVEQRTINELRRAGVTAASAEGQAIAALVADIERQKAAQKSLAEQTEFLKSTTSSFITTFRRDMWEGASAVDALDNAFSGLSDTIATKIEDRFAGGIADMLMGTTGGQGFGILNWLLGSTSSFPAAPKVGLNSVIGTPATGSLIAPSGAKAANMNVRIENNAPAKVSVAEEDDERGGKRLAVIIDEENAANNGRPGSKSARSLRSNFNVKPRLTKR